MQLKLVDDLMMKSSDEFRSHLGETENTYAGISRHPEGSTPGNPKATHGLSRGFVAKACPARGALERFCVFGKIPRGHTHGICT